MLHDYAALQSGTFPAEVRKEIESLGVTFHLVTQFTSFVAIEELRVTVGGKATTVAVPVEMPDGVRYDGIFGTGAEGAALAANSARFAGTLTIEPDETNHLSRTSVALVFQIRAVDRRIIQEQIGAITSEQRAEIYALLARLTGQSPAIEATDERDSEDVIAS
jgi:hypothetical protein